MFRIFPLFQEDHKLAQMLPEQREAEKRKLEESKKRHDEHEAVKHPGGRQQLEEVWEETDHVSLLDNHVAILIFF